MRSVLTWSVLMVLAWGAGCGGAQRGGDGLLHQGDRAPQLAGEDHLGRQVEVPGDQPVVLYFYPKDGTPGCTEEACAFRDAWERYEKAGVRIVGVSTDSVESHRAFAEEHGLQFSLISDTGKKWIEAYGVGQVLGLARRVSFVIDPQGQILKVYPDVDPGVHALEILDDLRGLGLAQ